MKILHTADWHIGKIVNNVHMTKEQEYVLNQFVDLVSREKPDVVIIAGDIYDRSVPPVEAVELLDNVFNKILLECKTPIIAIAGNHDSGDRVGFARKILRDHGLHIAGRLKKEIEKLTLEDAFGPVNFYVIPYADPAEVREIFNQEEIKTHDEATKVIIKEINKTINLRERNIAVFHGFVVGGQAPEESTSERPLSIGGTEYITYEHFKNFHYTALGHLHGPQKSGEEHIRYAGSLLKYSFSEVKHRKGVKLVELGEKGEVTITFKSLIPRRDMRIIKGELNKLLDIEVYKDTNTEDYLHVILTDEGELIDPINKLRSVYPNILSIEREVKTTKNRSSKTSAGAGYKSKSKLTLFQDFYVNITGRKFEEEKEKVMLEVIKEVEKMEKGE
ncbi:exonuclease SbcCD subunit D [Clostridium formicaceticum]|uniref:Nuclease SbcCD subunit D n=1 Tax=Clostridium formicaceticum TaxID=1497 RepID=A0AAC9RL35_9CLOT|nr:exonuclease SbcCD subunit D [Clostridium formicaceticum]AOY75911.1 exonuclease sbcCD subunit D [Clostridium formicaceticum]ARE86255.1 Nuclease SbcCD subunit D [Clostridium formicaceticum]